MQTMSGALANPALQRWLPVIVLPPILLLDGLLSGEGDHVDLLSVVIAVVATLPLALRERIGFFAMAPLLVGGVVLVLWDFEPGLTVVAIPAWALFDLARHYGRRQTLIAAVLVGPCVFVSVLPFADDGSELASITLLNLAWCEFALAAGYAMWHSRERAEREVAAREADAERRLGEERLRIAREVHDVVAHAMVAINVQSGVVAHLLDDDDHQAREALLQIRRTSGDALSDLRATLGVLRDPDQSAPVRPAGGLDDLEGVAAQLRAAGVDVTIDVAAAGSIPTAVQSASYRIVQEALTNVLRHADARTVLVVARADQDMLTLLVEDDGDGAAGPAASDGAGAGVRGMRERAEALGGMLCAGPSGEGGWRVEAALPLVAENARP
jgi:signal transduction histidine kinase